MVSNKLRGRNKGILLTKSFDSIGSGTKTQKSSSSLPKIITNSTSNIGKGSYLVDTRKSSKFALDPYQ